MTERSMRPAIRFKDFNDAWEQRKLGNEATEIVAGGDIKRGLLVEKGKYPVIANALTNDGIIGYYEDEYKTRAPAVTVTGRGEVGHAKARMTNFTPIVRLLTIKSDHDINFLENRINTLEIIVEFTGVPQLTIPQLAKYELSFPPTIQEEKIIGIYFEQIDNIITLHQREYDKILNFKKAMLEKMFPKNGKDKPEIRFKGFTDAWEQRKLQGLFEENNERNEGKYAVERTISISSMSFNPLGNGADEASLAKYKVLRRGDIAFEGHTNKEYAYGRFVMNDIGNGIMSPRFTTLRPKFSPIVDYWKYYIHYEPIMKSIVIRSTKAGTMMNELVVEDLLSNDVLVPSVDEQKIIGTYFVQLDNLITLHQRELEKLQNMKKSLLEKMFVQG